MKANTFKSTLKSCCAAASLAIIAFAAMPAYADGHMDSAHDAVDHLSEHLSGYVTWTSEYRFRGIDQSDDHPAIQGGIDYSAAASDDVDIYLGAWASTVDFGADNGTGSNNGTDYELDLFGGFVYNIAGFSIDTHFVYYVYPDSNDVNDYDYIEFGVNVGYDFDVAAIDLGIQWSPDYYAGSGTFYYLSAGVDVPLRDWLSAFAHVGYSSIDDEAAFGTEDYIDYAVGLSASYYSVDFSIGYYGTDLDDNECLGGSEACDGRFIGSVTVNF